MPSSRWSILSTCIAVQTNHIPQADVSMARLLFVVQMNCAYSTEGAWLLPGRSYFAPHSRRSAVNGRRIVIIVNNNLQQRGRVTEGPTEVIRRALDYVVVFALWRRDWTMGLI